MPGRGPATGATGSPGWWRWLLPLALIGLLVLPQFLGERALARVPYSTFQALLDSGKVASVVVSGDHVRLTLKAPDAQGRTRLATVRVPDDLAAALRARGVTYEGEVAGGWFEWLLGWMLMPLFLVAMWMLLSRRALGAGTAGAFGFAKSGAKAYAERDVPVTFADVAGVDEAKAELREVVAFLKDPTAFGRLGARVPRGILLVGPPGTGKTLLARAVAGESGVPFFSINGSEFVELFVGVGAARVRDLFARARESAPCIVFVDEIDALGRTRGPVAWGGANEEKEQTLNQLLAELDGFAPDARVVFLAATNRPETLDPALLRAGRFDRQVLVDRPDRAGRVQILTVHVRRVALDAGVDLDAVAALTPGFTGADLANLVNEAALAATRRGAAAVGMADFTAAVERIVAGLEKRSRVLTPRERRLTATHEMGHAIVALAVPGADPVHKVSIIPHGLGALGFTLQRPAEDRYIATRAELEGRMTVLLGGRAAELVAFEELSTGAADDLVKATELAREMVMRYGMDPTVGHVVYGERAAPLLGAAGVLAPESRMYSEATARDIEAAVRTLVARALERATAILRANRAALDAGAALLMERETLTREQLPAVVSVVVPADGVPGAPVAPGPPGSRGAPGVPGVPAPGGNAPVPTREDA